MNTDFIIRRRQRDENSGEILPASVRRHEWGAIIMAAASIGSALISKNKGSDAPGTAAPVNAGQSAGDVIKANATNEPDIEALLARGNQFNQGQANDIMESALPGWRNLQGKLSQTATDDLAHPYDVPKDVQDNLARIAAERGISAGTRGQFQDFSLLRDFGVNELAYGSAKIGQAQSITQMLATLSPKVNPMSPMSMYVTPAENLSAEQANRSAEQAALNAATAASNNQGNIFASTVGQLGGLFGGMMGGSGTNKTSEEFTNASHDD